MARQNRLYHNSNFRRLWADAWCDRATWVAENAGYSSGAADAVFGARTQLVQACQSLAYSPSRATSSSWVPSSTMRPSMTTAIRSAS
jgi:hypothetical protein